MSRQTTLKPRRIEFDDDINVHSIFVDKADNKNPHYREDVASARSVSCAIGDRALASRSLARASESCNCNKCQCSQHDHQAYKVSSRFVTSCENSNIYYCKVPGCVKAICGLCWIAHQKRHGKLTN